MFLKKEKFIDLFDQFISIAEREIDIMWQVRSVW